MKAKLLRIASGIGLAAFAFCFTGCEPEKSGLTDDQGDHGLIIMDHVTPEQWTEIKDVLDRTTTTDDALDRVKLYRIRHYSGDGKKQEEFGQLEESLLIEDFPPPPENFKGYAIQIGFGTPRFRRHPKTTPSPTPTSGGASPMPSATPITGHAHYRQNMIESKLMINAVDKILNPSPSPTP